MTEQNLDQWEAWMRAANRGDTQAYRQLLQAITPPLRKIVRMRGVALGHEGCEDVVQDVLLAIHVKRHTWREDAPLRPWLYAIARHKVVDAFRRRGRQIDISAEAFLDDIAGDPDPDPMQNHDMDKILGALDPRSADIVRGFGIHGETAADTAKRLNMSEGAVRVALHRALKTIAALRQRMIE